MCRMGSEHVIVMRPARRRVECAGLIGDKLLASSRNQDGSETFTIESGLRLRLDE
jgi:hypothetical protein